MFTKWQVSRLVSTWISRLTDLAHSSRCRFGPGRAIPLYTIVFGILSIGMAFVTDLGSGCAVRFLLGAAEAGMLPGIAYYLSRWYPKRELAFRLAMYLGESLFRRVLNSIPSAELFAPMVSLLTSSRSIWRIVSVRDPQNRLDRFCSIMGM